MQMTPRDKWIMAIFPGPVVILMYAVFFGVTANRAETAGREQLKAATATVPTEESLAAKRAALQEQTRRLAGEKQRAAKLLEPQTLFLNRSADEKTDALRSLSDVLARNNLSLLKSAKADGGGPRNSAPAFVALSVKMAELYHLPAPQFWLVKVKGPYIDMLKALQSLEQSKLLIVPVSVEMNPGKNGDGELEWSLTVWM